jgi:FkbM family methyltransferase
VIKSHLQQILRRFGAYDRIKETFAYDCYRYLRNGRSIFWRRNELEFYRSLLCEHGAPALVFDVGANRGQRTGIFVELGARVVAVEPDQANQRLLARRFPVRNSRPGRVAIVAKAASDAPGEKKFWIHEDGSGLNSLSAKWVGLLAGDKDRFGKTISFPTDKMVETVTLDYLVREFGEPAYIKIDVEGHEARVLRGLSSAAALLSFEVNLPEFIEEGLECVDILAGLDEAGRFHMSADCQQALSPNGWTCCEEFRPVLARCKAPSVEVFWRRGPAPALDPGPPVGG